MGQNDLLLFTLKFTHFVLKAGIHKNLTSKQFLPIKNLKPSGGWSIILTGLPTKNARET
jgi:hypothetical protein